MPPDTRATEFLQPWGLSAIPQASPLTHPPSLTTLQARVVELASMFKHVPPLQPNFVELLTTEAQNIWGGTWPAEPARILSRQELWPRGGEVGVPCVWAARMRSPDACTPRCIGPSCPVAEC